MSQANGNGVIAPSASGEPAARVLKSFDGFRVKEVLGCDPRMKTIFLHAIYKESEGADEQPAVILLEKKSFEEDVVKQLLSASSQLNEEMHNDIYYVYHMMPQPKLNELKATVILPATERHIEKYRFQDMFMINETADDYKNITLGHAEKQILKLDWVYNILEHKAETDRILYEDTDPETGFLIAPDLKWTGQDVDTLYVSVIVRKRGIKSIRDLTAEHLPMLTEIRSKLLSVVKEKYGLEGSQLKMYFHYQPSYYHLHVHAVNVKFDAPGQNIGKAILLDDVIDNLQLMSDFYRKKTLQFYVKRTDPLFVLFKDAGKVLL